MNEEEFKKIIALNNITELRKIVRNMEFKLKDIKEEMDNKNKWTIEELKAEIHRQEKKLSSDRGAQK